MVLPKRTRSIPKHEIEHNPQRRPRNRKTKVIEQFTKEVKVKSGKRLETNRQKNPRKSTTPNTLKLKHEQTTKKLIKKNTKTLQNRSPSVFTIRNTPKSKQKSQKHTKIPNLLWSLAKDTPKTKHTKKHTHKTKTKQSNTKTQNKVIVTPKQQKTELIGGLKPFQKY